MEVMEAMRSSTMKLLKSKQLQEFMSQTLIKDENHMKNEENQINQIWYVSYQDNLPRNWKLAMYDFV